MNILLLTSSMTAGGAERVAATLANAWSMNGAQVTLMPTFAHRQPCFYPLSPRVRLVHLADLMPKQTRSVLHQLLRLHALRRFIVKQRPDVIVSFLPNVNVAAILASAFLSIPLIICERSDPSSYPRFDFLNTFCRLTYRFADMLTVQTDSVANRIAEFYPNLKVVRVVPNPLPADVVTFIKTAGTQRKILLSLGRLSPEKQVDKLIAAFAELAPSFIDWDLHVYGEGPMKPELAKQIRQAGLQDRVLMKGGTTQPWKIMAAADAFAMTSRYEGFPNALLEAMGVGLPCVAFDCPSGPHEITRNGADALLVPLNDHSRLRAALSKLMGDDELRNQLGTQARESVCRRFGLQEVIRQWDHLFQEVGATH